VWHTAQKRAKEQELMFIGNQFRQALATYKKRTPARQKTSPMTLEELLKDPRYPTTERYLRKIYLDPMTGNTDWGLAKNPDGSIVGVYSLSEEEPMKQGDFREIDKAFEGKTKYADWIFIPASAPIATNPAATR
jgi:type II secretory pathway pseudopilin PulG